MLRIRDMEDQAYPPVICWFRRDLRLADNPALTAAAKTGAVLPVFILDEGEGQDPFAAGAASKVWLHHSLETLNDSFGGALHFYQGQAQDILVRLVEETGATAIFWNRIFEPVAWRRDQHVAAILEDLRLTVGQFNASQLFEPSSINKQDGTPYKVFSPYWQKGCLGAPPPRRALPKPDTLSLYRHAPGQCSLDDLTLLPTLPWGGEMMQHWQVGEEAAQQRFYDFCDEGLGQYHGGRDLPAKPFVSRLSPYLHFGEISPHQLWQALQLRDDAAESHVEHYCRELGWREFSAYQLWHNPDMAHINLQRKFDAFPWQDNADVLARWQRGLTGVPIVDAGMRQLWATGYMHNRVRMIVASYLVKNLLLDWRAGEAWFRDCLVDWDLASNAASWQWAAGSGADAAPYFRIFNPVRQAEKFDPDGDYIRQWVPELAKLPTPQLFAPWEASVFDLATAGVTLGKDYPAPVVDLKASRERALAAWAELKGQAA